MTGAELTRVIGLPPEQAIAWFEAKGLQLTGDWRELWREQHARAFTVARLTKLDVLQDIRDATARALREGTTERDFIRELTPILQSKGWWGKAVNPATGEVLDVYDERGRPVQYGSPRRLQLIYRQNLQSAYMAGRYQQQRDLAQADGPGARPYLQYLAVRDARSRPSHAALHGKVYRADDPAIDAIYPPNGFNCRCRMRALSERRLAAEGLSVETAELGSAHIAAGTLPDGTLDLRPVTTVAYTDPITGRKKWFAPDAGFDYNPGRGWHRPFTPDGIDGPPPTRPLLPGLACLTAGCTPPGAPPAPRVFDPALLLPAGRDDAYYIAAFLEMFGMRPGDNRMYADVTGQPLLIGSDLFLDRAKTARAGQPVYKLAKDEQRRTHMRMLAQTIIDPQEIWQAVEIMQAQARAGELVERRRYMGWWLVDGQDRPGLSVFEYAPAAYWTGVTVFAPHDRPGQQTGVEYMQTQRTGQRVWPKK